LSKKWSARIQSKVKDGQSQEAFMKLSSLMDYYNRPAEDFKDVIHL
jgi:hypothetical protein